MKSNACPLVCVEWEDSMQPIARWQWIEDFTETSHSLCVSVGWLIHDGKQTKVLAQNIAGLTEDSRQVSGVIRIPARCIVNITTLKNPKLISSCPSVLVATG